MTSTAATTRSTATAALAVLTGVVGLAAISTKALADVRGAAGPGTVVLDDT